MRTVLVANRGEVAVRIVRAAAEVGWRSVVVHAQDDTGWLAACPADAVRALPGRGAAAYLVVDAVVQAARDAGATHLHPGYGFLSESAELARRCSAAGVVPVMPSPEALDLLGDKAAARRLASDLDLPVTPGSDGAVDAAEAEAFARELGGPVVLKAVAGGGGRGLRVVRDPAAVAAAHAAATAEARAAFGTGDVYVEALVERARHVEVQVVGDGTDAVHLWTRDCTLQRRAQKVVELAPAPDVDDAALLDGALALARAVRLTGLATVEWLVGERGPVFLEVNPRLQVEHTVTEEVTGIDLVATQLLLADGVGLADVGLVAPPPRPTRTSVQLRVTAERLTADGVVHPATGTVHAFAPPTGPWLRVDTAAGAGSRVDAGFDPLLAKLVVSGPGDVGTVLRRAERAVTGFVVDGVETSVPLLRAVLQHPDVARYDVTTTWLQEHLAELVPAAETGDAHVLTAPTTGVVVAVDVSAGDDVAAGQALAVVEAMKMHFAVEARTSGTVQDVVVTVGDAVVEGQPLVRLVGAGDDAGEQRSDLPDDLDTERADLAEVRRRWALTQDDARPDAVARRHGVGLRTARENVTALLDEGSFTEYGAFALAAQRARRSEEDLLARSPADGLVTGVGTVDGATCAVAAYDYTVMAGTQGYHNHHKLDRLVELAHRWTWPLVLFAEGGGGRPGDTDAPWASALAVPTFASFAALSGRVPLVGVVNGNCFAGNAALLGCCDVVVATRTASIGMGGPAMVEGGGLGVYRPEEIGPVDVQAPNGVVDVLVDDEDAAVRVARHYLSLVRGDVQDWDCADQRQLRFLVPEERRRVYDVRRVLEVLADHGSVLELRRDFAPGMVTALARVEGHAFGILANDPTVVGGAVTATGADKAARLLNLCEAHRLPVLSLVDTPGFMVGPDSEREAAVRHMSRLFLRAAALTVPVFSVALRRGYGLGAMAMTGGEFRSPALNVSWPTGEFGPMGLEGAVRLGMRRELEAVEDPAERQRLFDEVVAMAYARGRATNVAAHLELDAVIDPAETRVWLVRGLRASPVPPERRDGVFVDAW